MNKRQRKGRRERAARKRHRRAKVCELGCIHANGVEGYGTDPVTLKLGRKKSLSRFRVLFA